ncbi:hypothetical protein GCM10011512_08610 [Tersicoccus solisilvae]|uniref:DNA topoisomerase n=1 Tax=Tersicoccus solisilvae TaxID=1882339 RepID=A0ABQ1NTD1_9MICC|nr:DNA topoisomerase IB [Tersicoccus solisilvae]GGC84089.1 hypothetical protein GCM10011512_08610 [Tersicoccus solisilvae]
MAATRNQRLKRARPSGPGFVRRGRGKGFEYLDWNGTNVTDDALKERFAALAIPPAWKDVWIAPTEREHIQAIGTDAAGRRQYIYHERWTGRRSSVKYERSLDLGSRMTRVRRAVSRDIAQQEDERLRCLAAAVRLFDHGSLRIGGQRYARDNGSYGVSTLLARHVSVDENSDTVRLKFRGKSGKEWDLLIEDDQLAAYARDRGGQGGNKRFLSYRVGRKRVGLTSTDINHYIADIAGGEFTAKDFRTWKGTVTAALSLADAARTVGASASDSAKARAVSRAMRETAETLHNTPAMARNSYVDPRVVNRFRRGRVIETGISPDRATVELLTGR